MRSVLRRTGWALAAAGGLGLAAPALGQPPAVRILGPGGHVPLAEEVGLMAESQARLEEGRVELAFLADPMLFSYALGTHVEGGDIEVRGYVPTEAAREEALRVAREHSTLHVTDKLKVLPGLTTHSAVDRPENIQRAARQLLEASFPEHGKAMGIRCDARGRVTVSGTVGSHEAKVLVSRKLRQVPGCSCVVNQLNVPGTPAAARRAETADLAAPDAPPVPARPAVRRSEPSAPARTVAAPARQVSDPPAPAVPRVYPGPAVPPAPPPEPPAPPRRWVPPAPPLDIPLPPAEPAEPRPALAGGASKDRPSASPSPDLSPASGAKPAPVKPTEGTLTLTPPPLPPSQPASAPVRLTAPPAKVPAPPALTPPPLPLPPPPSKVPPAPKHDLGGGEESYVAEGTITFDDPHPAKPAAASVKPLSPVPAKPAAGTITLTSPPGKSAPAPVTLTVAPAKVPAPPAPAPPPRPTVPPAVRLKERIQGVCGPAYAIKVAAGAEKNAFNVEVIGPKAGDQERLLGRIAPVLESPEFSAFQINCDISAPLK